MTKTQKQVDSAKANGATHGVVVRYANPRLGERGDVVSTHRSYALAESAAKRGGWDDHVGIYEISELSNATKHNAVVTKISSVPGGSLDEFSAAVSFYTPGGIYAGERNFTGRLRGNEPDALNFHGIGCDGATDSELQAIGRALVSINSREH